MKLQMFSSELQFSSTRNKLHSCIMCSWLHNCETSTPNNLQYMVIDRISYRCITTVFEVVVLMVFIYAICMKTVDPRLLSDLNN